MSLYDENHYTLQFVGKKTDPKSAESIKKAIDYFHDGKEYKEFLKSRKVTESITLPQLKKIYQSAGSSS